MESKMAYQNSNVTKPAAGDAAPTGMQKTPPPVRPAPDDDVTNIRHPSPPGYGRSHPGNNPSALAPGRLLQSDLAANLEFSQHASNPEGLTLDHIRQHGTARDSSVDLQSSQTRKIDATQLPASFGLKNQSDPKNAVTVPSKMGSSPFADEATRRAAALKRTTGE
jgi:hypothetical protein